MENVPFTRSEIVEQCRYHRQNRSSDDLANFVVLRDRDGRDTDFAVKIASAFDREGLRYDLARAPFQRRALFQLGTAS